MAAYQSGFDYGLMGGATNGGDGRVKPGLTCHVAAMEAARLAGMAEYDFLGGDSRYKRSLATDVRALHWATWQRRGSLAGVAARVRQVLGRQ